MTDSYLKDTNGNEFTLYSVGESDYPSLGGRIVEYDASKGDGDGSQDRFYTGLVVGCNTDIGITIVNAQDKDDYLVCITGPVAPGGSNVKNWDQGIWEYMVNAINCGLVEVSEIRKFTGATYAPFWSGGPSGNMCAYGQ